MLYSYTVSHKVQTKQIAYVAVARPYIFDYHLYIR